jgi:parvulin-like peptidyl-prolyl isomerase
MVVLMAPVVSCGPVREDAGAVPIAQVGGREILLRDFEPMLRATATGSLRDLSDAVGSRLLDQYLEQQVLLEEARRRGIEVEDADLDHAMAREGGLDGDRDYREKMRTSLTVNKLLRTVLAESAAVTPEEEERFFQENPQMFHRPAVLVLRQILLDDRESAALLRVQLAQEPERFADAARQHSRAPDRGSPRSYVLDDLPREALAALRDLKAGKVSPVVEISPGFVIFLLVEKRKQRNVTLEEARPRIQARLQESRGETALTRLLADLRRKLDVKLYEENLPFRYIQEEPA